MDADAGTCTVGSTAALGVAALGVGAELLDLPEDLSKLQSHEQICSFDSQPTQDVHLLVVSQICQW